MKGERVMKIKKEKSLFSIVLFFTVLFCAAPVMAMPSDADSNTAQMRGEWVGFPLAVGASGDFVLERALDNGEDLESNEWYGANIYFDPVERLHFNLFLGAAQGDLEDLRVALSTGGLAAGVTGIGASDTAFAFGMGAKADVVEFDLLPDRSKAELFVSGGYRRTNPDLESAVGSNGLQPTILDMEIELQEWQAGVGVKQRFDNLIPGISFFPYLGVKYSDVDLDLSGTSSFPAGPGVTASIVTGSRESNDNVGLFLGLQVLGWENRFSFDVEGRWIEETAVYLNGHIRW